MDELSVMKEKILLDDLVNKGLINSYSINKTTCSVCFEGRDIDSELNILFHISKDFPCIKPRIEFLERSPIHEFYWNTAICNSNLNERYLFKNWNKSYSLAYMTLRVRESLNSNFVDRSDMLIDKEIVC